MNEKEYIKSLENLLIFMCQTYEDTQKTLLELSKTEKNDAAFKVPTIQGLANTVGISKMAKMEAQKGIEHGFLEVERAITEKRTTPAEPVYKYNEFTPQEFAHFNKTTSGKFTYMEELPHGTQFLVHNGNWKGKVIHKDDGVYLQTTLNDNLCLDGENQFKIDHVYSLWISLLETDA